jgi:hypothetical protein
VKNTQSSSNFGGWIAGGEAEKRDGSWSEAGRVRTAAAKNRGLSLRTFRVTDERWEKAAESYGAGLRVLFLYAVDLI